MIVFKKMELIGFKSFADKTVIPFTDGITCIVGPNGCGKSNVADAICWVLGEQSAKMLRGASMTDVIFNGTEKRRPTSYCEVTLSFDNTMRTFDIDCDELEMTRRLYRDGSSEYMINRQPSRLKVLTELLHGAGAAKEGYSIIGQGRIEQIMNSKPTDRRAIFEEATGIAVYKGRKADAERKLASAKDNLYIFLTRLHEVEHQLAPAEKAAESALKHQQLSEALRSNEINVYIYQHDTNAEKKAAINAKLDGFNSEIAELTAKLDALLREYENCRESVNNADGELAELNEKLTHYRVGIEHKSGEGRLLQERAKTVSDRLRATCDEITGSTKRISEIEQELRRIEMYRGRNADRAAKLDERCAAIRAELAELSKSIGKFEAMNDENRKKVLETFKDLSDLNKNMGSLEAQRELLQERLAEVQSTLEEAKKSHAKLSAEYEASMAQSGKIEAFLSNETETMERAQAEVTELEEKIRIYTTRTFDARSQIDSLNGNLATVRALRDRFEGYIYSVRNLMNAAKGNDELSFRIQGLMADIITTDGEYEVAIETAFGGAMQNIVTKTREDAKYLIEYLKRMRGGQVTFLPIDAMRPRLENEQIRYALKERGALGYAVNLVNYDKKFENIVHNLLGNTLIVDNIENATQISRRFPRAFKIVTLDGDVITTSGSMSGGSRKDNAGNLLANERRVKEIEDEIESKKQAMKRAQASREQAEQDLVEKQAALEALRDKFQSSKTELAAIEQKNSSLLQQMSSEDSRLTIYSQTYDMIMSRLSDLDNQYRDTSKGASDLNEQSSQASTQMEDLSSEYDKLIEERNEKTEELNAALVEKASLESSIKSSAENTDRLTAERTDLTAKIESLNSQIPAIESELEEINIQSERASLTAEEQAVVDDLRRQIEKITSDKVTYNERIRQIDDERTSINTRTEELREKRGTQQIALTKLDSDLEFMQERIMTEYGEDYEGCLKYKVDDFDIAASYSQITSLKRQITMLGPVNPNAMTEYNAIKERYDKMIAEKEDMEKAINDLQVALDDIREEMLKIFDEGFSKINENFKITFKELFGGGKAELQLDYSECEDPLEAGVDIVACPPGKKLTKISLLSGGERALTAIAILFAIIGMRPMPFCVLDEIEAALDEANVYRYANYLKKFSSQTQFIVITHRKPTMENADTLFGVTMEEKGVSKIVSVKLSEVETKLGGDTIM